MSVILDALRKLDREKLSRRKGINIATDIVTPNLVRPRKRIPIFVVGVVVAAFAAAVITYGVMSQFGLISKSSTRAEKNMPVPNDQVVRASSESPVASKLSIPAPANPPAARQPVSPISQETAVPSKISPQSTLSRPAAATNQTPAPIPRAPVSEAQKEMIRVPPKIQSPEEKKERADIKILSETQSPGTSLSDKKTSQDVIPKQVETAPQKTAEPTPNRSLANPASLKLSAIAWFEEPSRRFAMINGIMATEGSTLDGIKVVEINPTSVRLLHDGQYFEISMSK